MSANLQNRRNPSYGAQEGQRPLLLLSEVGLGLLAVGVAASILLLIVSAQPLGL